MPYVPFIMVFPVIVGEDCILISIPRVLLSKILSEIAGLDAVMYIPVVLVIMLELLIVGDALSRLIP